MFDVFYIGNNPKLSENLPFATQVSKISDIKCQTKMYWLIEPNVEITDNQVLDYRPEDHDSRYEHIWKWNSKNYGGVRLIPKDEACGIKEINQVVCKKSFSIINTPDPGEYFTLHPYAEYVWCVDPDYKLDTYIDWAPDNFEPEYIHSFHLRGQLEHRYPESEGGIKLYPRDWTDSQTKYHGFLDANIKYPVMYVEDVEDYSQRDLYTDDYVWLIDTEHCINPDSTDWVPNPFEDGYIHCFRMPYQLCDKYPQKMGGIRLVPKDWQDTDIKIHSECPVEDINYDVFYTNKEFNSDTFEYYAKRSDTEWFWVIDRDYEFNGKLLYVPSKFEEDFIHVFKIPRLLEFRYLKSVTELWDQRVSGVYLVNKNFDFTKQKLHITDCPIKYDVFSEQSGLTQDQMARKSKTDMFWIIPDSMDPSKVAWLPESSEWSKINFFNNGIKLVPTEYSETNTIMQGHISGFEPTEFQKFTSEETGMKKSEHDWFWVIDPDVDVVAEFDFSYMPDDWDSGTTHVWQVANPVTGLNYDYAGVKLCHKQSKTGRPKYIKKVASIQKMYDILHLDPAMDILEQLNGFQSNTKMFWVIDPWTELHPDFDFSVYPTQWDQNCVHVFKDENGTFRNVRLVPSGYEFESLEQITNNSFADLKEHNFIASTTPQWPVLHMKTQSTSELTEFADKTKSPWFFTIDPDVEITHTKLCYEPNIDDHNRVHAWQKLNPHTNAVHGYGGVRLWPTEHLNYTTDQIRLNKIPRIRYVKQPLSAYKKYPIVLLSYLEERAQKAYEALRMRSDRVHWVKDVKGIFEAHKEAAKLSGDATMFWVVDADAELAEDFNFSYIPDVYDQETVHVWASLNPVTGSKYGYGGVKLFNTQQVMNATSWGLDFTTGLSKRFKFMPEVSCTTMFNTTAYDTWRSAFREVVKLTVSTDPDSQYRIDEWLNPLPDADFHTHALRGAQQAQEYAKQHINNATELDKINDYDWLKKKFTQG
jgi:hypothetical protein